MTQPASEPDRPPQDEASQQAGAELAETVQIAYSGAESNTSDQLPPSGDETVEYVELARVYNAADLSEARLVKGLLESAQIPAVIEDDASGALTDALTGARLDGTDVFVPTAFVSRARAVLRQAGYASELDRDRLRELLAELEAVADADDEARARFVDELEQEPSRETRLAVLRRVVQLPGGTELLRSFVAIALERDDEELSRLVGDVALLVAERELPESFAELLVHDLGQASRSERAVVRRRAAAALSKLRGLGAAKLLVPLLEDPDPAVRDEAIESLY
ncbi:MAG: DUF2007 domain-containing protein, partial [Planctomycetota bacterium]